MTYSLYTILNRGDLHTNDWYDEKEDIKNRNMIEIRNLKYDGRQRNHQNGLTFYFTKHCQMLSFLIDVVEGRKRKIKVTMHPDINHDRAHIHINEHGASFAVDTGELLAGGCDNETRLLIENWITRHRDDLFQLWDIVKRGGDYQPTVKKIRLDKSFEEYGFRGNEPQYKAIIDGAVIWHNDELLTERQNNGSILVIGAGDMFVILPAGYPDDYFTFESLSGTVQVKRMANNSRRLLGRSI